MSGHYYFIITDGPGARRDLKTVIWARGGREPRHVCASSFLRVCNIHAAKRYERRGELCETAGLLETAETVK
jgi:hypothetical protein